MEIDKNKPLEEYTDGELLEALNSKKEADSYFLLKLVFEENKKSSKYYHLFEDFMKMIYDKNSFKRMRGFSLCCSLTKWDVDNKIDTNLDELCILLEDEKPITVRTVLSCLEDVVKVKPYLGNNVKDNLVRVNYYSYKDSMIPLIKKDLKRLYDVIDFVGGM